MDASDGSATPDTHALRHTAHSASSFATIPRGTSIAFCDADAEPERARLPRSP
jgi:hypothetical protein